MIKGIEKANELFENRAKRVQELKGDGKKIVGYLLQQMFNI